MEFVQANVLIQALANAYANACANAFVNVCVSAYVRTYVSAFVKGSNHGLTRPASLFSLTVNLCLKATLF